MASLNEFLSYLSANVNRGIYVWGGQSHFISGGIAYKTAEKKTALGEAESWIKKVENATNANRAIKLYRKRLAAGITEMRCVDCSGLGMNYLQNISGLSATDMNANGMKGKCRKLDKSELKKGDWVFRVYKSGKNKGRAHHVGYVINDYLDVEESRGRDDGVVVRAFDSAYWNYYGRPSYFAEEIEGSGSAPAKIAFTRVLKRVSPMQNGADVRELQRLLNEADGSGLAADGIFGKKTEKAVKAFQKSKGLTVDGKAGKNTIGALGGTWRG